MFRKLTPACLLAMAVMTVVVTSSNVETGRFFRRGYGARPVAYFQPVLPVQREFLASAPAGSTLTLPCNFLGPEAGSAFLVFNDIKLPVCIDNWQETTVTLTMPPMTLRRPLRVSIDVVTPHGKLVIRKPLLITPPADMILHPAAPRPPLPTNAALMQSNVLPAGN